MNSKKQLFRSIAYLVIIVNCSLFIANCGKKLDPDPLPLTVKQNLALLQTDPQFVMYFNFKKMRDTKFWEQFLSDSVFSAERNFGGFLNLINQAAGVSISNGIDEMYFSNSWIGDNAIVVKGTFDRKRVNDYITADTLYTKIDYPNGITVYKQVDANLNFYFKDDFTLCASNYLKQIENTFAVTDTSTAGLLTNFNLMKEIEQIKHKENLWMISNQKLFIRGIFENFSDMNKKKSNVLPGGEPSDSLSLSDTTQNESMNELFSIYKKINSVAFSLKMTDDIEIVMQNECEDPNSATELKNRMEAVIALAKLSTSLSGKKPPPAIKLLDKVETEVFNNTVILEAKLNENDIKELRQQKIF
ncbi:MAG TPA: hypothetical protein PKE39_00370 [Ignavibacteria bacterium]|nr:hypothetical protein [Ignavibacteria bacterium]HMQ97449.1 hypothetical protein [Ignavibacteria bacterium]